MINIRPPHDFLALIENKASVFLAGSIEMGKAVDWQQKVTAALTPFDVAVLNPRRADWDSTWVQDINNPHFKGQVEWELLGLEKASKVIFYFDPQTQSPITLLELGFLAARAPEKMLVCCPDGFWRKGNVDVVCARYGVRQAPSLDEMIARLMDEFHLR
jgi:hypothetical protein